MSITIERVFNGFVVHDPDFGDIGRKIVVENLSPDFYQQNLDGLKCQFNLLEVIVDLLCLNMKTADEKHSIVLAIKDDQGNILDE